MSHPHHHQQPQRSRSKEPKWYILQVYSGFENKVADIIKEKVNAKDLGDLLIDIIVPMQEVVRVKRGKKSTASKNFLPGYILIKAELTEELLGIIRGIDRVSSFLGGKGLVPTPVSEEEVNKILERIEENVTKENASTTQFEVGESVSISEGPFASFSGVIEEVDNTKSKLKISVSIFDRLVPVEVEFNQVEKIIVE